MPNYTWLCTGDSRATINWNISDPPLEIDLPFKDQLLRLRLFMYNNPAMMVAVEASHPIRDIGDLGGALSHTLWGLWDAVGLSMGQPISITVDGFAEVGSRAFAKYSWLIPKFEQIIEDAGLSPNDWISLCVKSPYIRAALRDLRFAMSAPDDAAVHCFRAIERIRFTFENSNISRKASWGALRTALNVSRPWLSTYVDHATATRHGEVRPLTLDERTACIVQAGTLLVRFAAYLANGSHSLAVDRFPVLE